VPYVFVPGNNDWWMPRVMKIPQICYHKTCNRHKLVEWLFCLDGGNYKDLPWSHHHDTISREDEQQWAILMELDCPKEATVLASHFPFVAQSKEGFGYAMSWWNAAIEKTNIKTLVFGHLHEEYFDSIPNEHGGRKIQVVSDHRERLLHEIQA